MNTIDEIQAALMKGERRNHSPEIRDFDHWMPRPAPLGDALRDTGKEGE